jgi:hypothetical protein
MAGCEKWEGFDKDGEAKHGDSWKEFFSSEDSQGAEAQVHVLAPRVRARARAVGEGSAIVSQDDEESDKRRRGRRGGGGG